MKMTTTQALSLPLLDSSAQVQSRDIDDAPSSRGTFRLCSCILGLLFGMVSQTNTLSTQILELLSVHLTLTKHGGLFLYAIITTVQLLLILLLLRTLVMTAASSSGSKDMLFDLDLFFGVGSLMGVSLAWVGVVQSAANSEWLILLLLMTISSVSLFSSLMWAVYYYYSLDDSTETTKQHTKVKDEASKKDTTTNNLKYTLTIA